MAAVCSPHASLSEVLLESLLRFSLRKRKLKTTLLREFDCHVQTVDICLKRGNIYICLLFPSAVSTNEYCHNPANFGRECFFGMCVCVRERERERERKRCVCKREREKERDVCV